MEDSRKGKKSGKKGLSTLDPHVDGGNGKKAMVYNTKRKKIKKKKKRKSKELSTLSQSIRVCPRILSV